MTEIFKIMLEEHAKNQKALNDKSNMAIKDVINKTSLIEFLKNNSMQFKLYNVDSKDDKVPVYLVGSIELKNNEIAIFTVLENQMIFKLGYSSYEEAQFILNDIIEPALIIDDNYNVK